jgi:predicted O-linked N-acetylglucosamine transferase (SPINDLY family)
VLAAVPGSKLLVVGRAGNPVRSVLESHGIAPERIELIDRQPVADYLKLHHRVDFLLDTFPYTGGTTNILAAWMGVPFVTLQGTGSAERSGAVLLTSLGLPELIARSTEEYVEKAVAAAADLEFLGRCRASLRGRLDPVLGDGSAFTRCLEKAFRGMWQRWCARKVSAANARPPEPALPEPALAVEN